MRRAEVPECGSGQFTTEPLRVTPPKAITSPTDVWSKVPPRPMEIPNVDICCQTAGLREDPGTLLASSGWRSRFQ